MFYRILHTNKNALNTNVINYLLPTYCGVSTLAKYFGNEYLSSINFPLLLNRTVAFLRTLFVQSNVCVGRWTTLVANIIIQFTNTNCRSDTH